MYQALTPFTDAWKQGALGKINAVMQEPLRLHVVNVVGGGDDPWAVLELEANGTCKNGGFSVQLLGHRARFLGALLMRIGPGMAYPQRYAWMLRFDEKGIIVQVRWDNVLDAS